MAEGTFITCIAFGLTCLTFLSLSLSLRRHYQQVFAETSAYEQRRWLLRLSGYGCLALALWPCVRASGPWVGLVLWISMAAAGGFLQALLLTYRPRASALLAGFGVALIALGFLL